MSHAETLKTLSSATQEHFDGTEPNDRPSLHERHPDWPALDLTFYFSPHGNKADFEGINPLLEATDVYLYEDIFNNSAMRAFLQRLSTSPPYNQEWIADNVSAGEAFAKKGSEWEPVIDSIYNSQKIISSIDLRETSEEKALADKIWQIIYLPLPKGPTFDAALPQFTEQQAELVKAQEERESIMADRFEEEIEHILDVYPELKERKNLKILISMGVNHTKLRHAFTMKGIPSDREFSSSPYVYNYRSELKRTLAYAREPTKDLSERAYIEDLLDNLLGVALKKTDASYDVRFAYLRNVVSKLNHEQMKDIYDLYNNGKLTVRYIDNLLQNIGMQKLPRSDEELMSPPAQKTRMNIAQRALSTLGFKLGNSNKEK